MNRNAQIQHSPKNMKILTDNDINTQLQSGELLLDADKYNRAFIHPASLDLTVGRIYVPGTEEGKLGSVQSPRAEYSMMEGATAVIETSEVVKLNSRQLGIVFLPSGQSSKGLLTTNPGLVDPGYEGPLHLTLINMGRLPFELKSGQRILRVVIFEMSNSGGGAKATSASPVSAELLDRLSKDFLSIDDRVSKELVRQDTSWRKWQIGIPLIVAVIALVGGISTALTAYWSAERQFGNRITKLEQQLADQKGDPKINDRLTAIETQIRSIESSRHVSIRGN